MKELVIYHGSPEIVEIPLFGKGKPYNDYGQGFYCTEEPELAKEWAVNEGTDGYVNMYRIDTDGLRILNLSSEEFSILNWIAILVQYRKLRTTSPVMRRGREWLESHYLIDIEPFDAITGYRADDSYFAFARAFLDNAITVEQLSRAMKLGELGEQFVLKSREAFRRIKFDSFTYVKSSEYYPKRKGRDEAAREAFFSMLDTDEADGIYLRDLIGGGVSPDDPRLR